MKFEIRDGVLEIENYVIKVRDINTVAIRYTKFFWSMLGTSLVALFSALSTVVTQPMGELIPFFIGAVLATFALICVGLQFGVELVIGTPAEVFTFKVGELNAPKFKETLSNELRKHSA